MIPAGSGNTERHIAMIEDYGTTVLIATPSYALHVCEVGERLGFDWEASTLRVGLFGGEPCPPGLKAEIERRMHIVCTDNYGLTEVMGPGVSGECLAVARHAAHRGGPLPVGGGGPRDGRARAGGRSGRAGAHAAGQAGHPRAALPHARPDARRLRAVRLRAHDGAHAEGALALRRHAHHPRHERVPQPGGRRACRHRGRDAPLPHRGGQRGRASTA